MLFGYRPAAIECFYSYTEFTCPKHALATGRPFKVNGELKMLKRLALILGLMSVFFLTACNTMKGAGQDIQTGGEKLEDKATEEQRD